MKRIYNALSWLIVSVMVCTFTYGILRFPDNPIHPCAVHDYCGKQGQPHTLDDFLAFDRWETFVFFLWPSGIISLMFLRLQIDKHSSSHLVRRSSVTPKDNQIDLANVLPARQARPYRRVLQWLLIVGGPIGFVLIYIPLTTHFTTLQSGFLTRSVIALTMLPGIYGVTLIAKESASRVIGVAVYILVSLIFIITCLQMYSR